MTRATTELMIAARPAPFTKKRRRRDHAVGVALAAVGGLLCFTLTATPSFAYVRYRSESGCPYGWSTRSLPITVFPQGLAGMTVEEITNAATRGAAVWSKGDPALAACTDLDLKLSVQPVDAAPPDAKYDHRNNVVFRSDTWCSADGMCHESSALAITSVFARTWGQIVDADIEVNGVNFLWADLVTSQAPTESSQDLQNALTHEMGHLIGLDHSCSTDPSGPAPKDQNGQPVPLCSGAPTSVRATTMFASADPGDISKRDLEPDDQQAVCDTYPRGAADKLACDAPDSGGCGIAPVGVSGGVRSVVPWVAWGGGAAVVALALAGLRAGRRRSRRR